MLDAVAPTGVASFKLGAVAQINPRMDARLDRDEIVPFVPMAAVSAVKATVEAEEKRSYAEVAKSYTFFRDGDVLVAKITPCFENNKIAQANLSGPVGFGSTEFHVIRAEPSRLDPRYLLHFLRQDRVREEGERKMTGSAGQRRVPAQVLADLSLPLPPLTEQRRIAAILDEADSLRAKRRAALAQLDEMAQAVFVEMFGRPEELGVRWDLTPLGGQLEFLTSGSRGWAAYYADEGDLFLRIQNVRSDELDLKDVAFVRPPATAEARRTRVKAGDVLLSITADLGRTAVVPPDLDVAYINQHLAILRTKRLEPRFLSAYLASPLGQEQIVKRNRQGVKAGLNFEDIHSVAVPAIPLAMQHDFVVRIEQSDVLRRQARGGLITLNSLFASLQHRAFRGEL